MKMTMGMQGAAVALLGLVTLTGTLRAQAPAAAPPPRGAAVGAEERPPGDLPGPIDTLTDLQDTGRLIFMLADVNNDRQISKKEAVDFGNLLVGGFFFRADQNGDGKVTREEARAARENLLQQKPVLRYIVQRAKAQQGQPGGQGTSPFQNLANLLDINNDNALEATELRQAVQTAVEGTFATADTNRDQQLSTVEINAAMIGVARSIADASFRAADTDNNGALSRQEFDKAIIEPANMVFTVLDVNGDGQLSQQELQRARQVVFAQLQAMMIPEPPNSPRNLIQSGRLPGEVAPIPNVPIRAPGQPAAAPPAPGT
ncbi:MAG: hypothetical protein IRY99_22960, partial [Isosphaeraceae bacterium]|nr:hypothetical protein [Isosphaeraceae bacterium]